MAVKHKSMQKITLINGFDITSTNFDNRFPRRGRIGATLWHALAGDADFDPRDERLQELCWGYVFARFGLSSAARCPEGLVFHMAFDVPTGPNIFRLLPSLAPDSQTVSFSLL